MIKSVILSRSWREHLIQYQTLYVGLSGGLDSTVLLHHLAACTELVEKLVAVHVHHGLSPNADSWEKYCQQLCLQWKIPLYVSHVHIDSTHNLEQHARTARYQVFETHVGQQDALLLAHHQDDQAETLLLQLCRGTGVHGLAAMPAIRPFAQGKLIRPLLDTSRESLYRYAIKQHLTWVEDESNEELDFSRNVIRHQVIPILKQRWPNVVKNISECSKICQSAKNSLEYLADLDVNQVTESVYAQDRLACHMLDMSVLPWPDKDRVMNILYVWLKRNHVSLRSAQSLAHLWQDVISAREDAQPLLSWGGVSIRRYRQKLYIVKETSQPLYQGPWKDFPNPIQVDEKRVLTVSQAPHQGVMIQPLSVVEIRTRQGGERFIWRGQSKRLKNLFQEWGVPPWERDRVPLVFVDNQLKVVVGYAHADENKIADHSQRMTIQFSEIVEREDVTAID